MGRYSFGEPGCVFFCCVFVGLPAFALAGAVVNPPRLRAGLVLGWLRWILRTRAICFVCKG